MIQQFEKRIEVCVADPGVLNWPEVVDGFLQSIDPSLAGLWAVDPVRFDGMIRQIAAQVPLVDWGMRDMMWKHGADSPSGFMAAVQAYNNEEIVSKITCRVLVVDGTADEFSQGRRLYDALDCPKDYLLFTAEDTGLQHCQVGAQGIAAERIFDWLDANL